MTVDELYHELTKLRKKGKGALEVEASVFFEPGEETEDEGDGHQISAMIDHLEPIVKDYPPCPTCARNRPAREILLLKGRAP